MNAIAHAVEGLYAQDASPITDMISEDGIRALAAGLPRVVASPRDRVARSDCLYGAWLCGTALGSVGMALHHKLCHVLGGTWSLPHAETHTIVLPQAISYNVQAAARQLARAGRALGNPNVAQALFDLAAGLCAPMALRDIGMKESELDRAAELAVQSPYYNPQPIERGAIRALLDDAFFGRRPK